MSADLDEWRHAVRDMTEVQRNNTAIELRTAAGVNSYADERDDR